MRDDSLRQVVHELRTPLNAIGGFAEMIRRQLRGPVATPYRERAGEIVRQAGRLLAAVEDIDVAARLDGQRIDLDYSAFPLAPLIREIAADHGPGIAPAVPDDLPPVLGDVGTVRRIIARVAEAAVAMADRPIAIVGKAAGGTVALRIARPARLAGLSGAALLDPELKDGGAGSPLGLAFTLRLATRLARAGGGTLRIDPDWFVLDLPEAVSNRMTATR